MLSPEQRAARLRTIASDLLGMDNGSPDAEILIAAATALANELGLAEQVCQLRKALEAMPRPSLYLRSDGKHYCCSPQCVENRPAGETVEDYGHVEGCWIALYDSALALVLPEAARQAAENAEKAGLLEWACTVGANGIMPLDDIYRMWDRRREAPLIDEIRAAKEADRG